MTYMITLSKAVITFVALWALARILGKKLISRLTLFDFLAAITLGTLSAQAILPNQPSGPILAAAATFAGLSILFNWLDLKGLTILQFLDGEPTVLVENGKVLEDNLRRNRLTIRQLESQLRLKGYFSLAEVEFALLETNGKISVQPKSQFRFVKPADLHVPTSYEGLATQVMHEGKALPERLKGAGLSEEWLRQELACQGITDPSEVFGAWLQSNGALTVDRYDDRPH